jgi:hypothetical protein
MVTKRPFGQTDMQVVPLGYGGAEIGFQSIDGQVVSRALNEALDAGLNVIDTAECYGGSEELIGDAVAHRRAEYYLFTKCGHAAGFEEPDWDPGMLAKQIDRSLKRLKTDCVDLLQLHSCSKEILERGDAIEVVQRARDAGKTRYIGYSGDGEDALYAVQCGVFDALQTSISAADQQAMELTLPVARERRMGVIAKRPIANAVWLKPERPVGDYAEPYWLRLQELDYAFLKGDPRRAVQMALRFTLSVPGVSVAIVGTTKPGRWRENLSLLRPGPLTIAEYDAIRARWKLVAGPDWVGQT